METTLAVFLMLACAYLNARLLSVRFKRKGGVANAILLGALVANFALMYVTNFHALIALVVWLPAVGGVLAERRSGRKG